MNKLILPICLDYISDGDASIDRIECCLDMGSFYDQLEVKMAELLGKKYVMVCKPNSALIVKNECPFDANDIHVIMKREK